MPYSNNIYLYKNNLWETLNLASLSQTSYYPCDSFYFSGGNLLTCGLNYYYNNCWKVNNFNAPFSSWVGFGLGRFYSINVSSDPNGAIDKFILNVYSSNPGEGIDILNNLFLAQALEKTSQTFPYYSPVISNSTSLLSITSTFEFVNNIYKQVLSGSLVSDDGTNFREILLNFPYPSGTTLDSPIGIA